MIKNCNKREGSKNSNHSTACNSGNNGKNAKNGPTWMHRGGLAVGEIDLD